MIKLWTLRMSKSLFKFIMNNDEFDYIGDTKDNHVFRFSNNKIAIVIYVNSAYAIDYSIRIVKVNAMKPRGKKKSSYDNYYMNDFYVYKIAEKMLYLKENYTSIKRQRKLKSMNK